MSRSAGGGRHALPSARYAFASSSRRYVVGRVTRRRSFVLVGPLRRRRRLRGLAQQGGEVLVGQQRLDRLLAVGLLDLQPGPRERIGRARLGPRGLLQLA